MKILFISHEASLTGAPKVLLHFMRWLSAKHPEIELLILLGKSGLVEHEFRSLGETYIWHSAPSLLNRIRNKLTSSSKEEMQSFTKHQRQLIRSLRKKKIDLVYGNTVLVAPIMEALKLSVPSVLHVHELKYNVEQYGNSPSLKPILAKADRVIAVSKLVYNYLQEEQQIETKRLRLVHEFIEPLQADRQMEDVLTNLPENAFIIGGCGTINWRKGTDLFVQVANQVLSEYANQPIYFVWLGGNLKHSNYHEIQYDIDKLGWSEQILFVGSHANPQDYFKRFDLFLMTSREDPFPLVCLENAQIGNPIICFEGAVGSEEFINDETGGRVAYLDTSAMAQEVIIHYLQPKKRTKASKNIQHSVAEYTVDNKAPELLTVLQELIQVEFKR